MPQHHTHEHRFDRLSLVPPVMTIVSLLLGAAFWFYTMNGIPPRVTEAEKKLIELEKAQAKTDVKADLTLQAVYEIRSILLKGKE